jgi:hypothetical protein
MLLSPMQVSARLLHAWGKTTVAQHVVARHLVHAFECLTVAYVSLVVVSPLVEELRV